MINTVEDVALQSVILQYDADTTYIGEAPQYIKDNNTGTFVSVTENDPYWVVKKIVKTGGNKLSTRYANGSNKYEHTFSLWASYTY